MSDNVIRFPGADQIDDTYDEPRPLVVRVIVKPTPPAPAASPTPAIVTFIISFVLAFALVTAVLQ